jgi:hypothetical protein
MSFRLNEEKVNDMSFVSLYLCFDNFSWSSWQLQMHEYRVTNLQIEQDWIQMKGVHLYQIQVVLGDDDIRIAPTSP